MPLITLGIPVFNAMPYLPESLESILQQSSRDFEILAINDGSTDDSLKYLQSVKDRRLRIIDQENRGLTATLNRMLSEVNTPWLARHDADDVAYPNRIERTIEFIRRYPDAGMFYSLAEYYPRGTVGLFRTTKGSPDEIRSLVLSGYLPAICHPSVTLNVDKALRAGSYRFNLHVEDIDLWWRMAIGYDIRLIPEATLGFRQNTESVSSANLQTQALNTLYVQYLLLSHLWNLQPLPYEEVRKPLSTLFNRRRLRFKTHMRAFNIQLGLGHKCRAWSQASLAFCASPRDFMNRVFDEVLTDRAISLGENPAVFRTHAQRLWPKRTDGDRKFSHRPEPETDYTPVAGPESNDTSLSLPLSRTTASVERIRIGHADIHATTFNEAVDLVLAHAATSTLPAYVVTPNAQCVVLLENDARLRDAYENASLVLPDGFSLLLGAQILGKKFKQRVPGVDLFQSLCGQAARIGLRVFLLGGKPGSAERAVQALKQRFPGLVVAGTLCPPLGFERDANQLREIAEFIRDSKPHLLFVGFGAPKQENWIYEHGRKLGVPVCIGIGGSFEMVGGVTPRAPRYLQKIGLEWLFRLAVEPRRLWRRYLIGNAQFIKIVFTQFLNSDLYPRGKQPGLEKRS